MLAVILSILLPGLGQIYYGKTLKGLLMILLTFTFLYPFILVWSVWDVLQLRKKHTPDPVMRKETMRAVFTVLIAVPITAIIIYAAGFFVINPFVKKHKTKQEVQEIAFAINEYYAVNKTYPPDLYSLTLNRPLRKNWIKDAWKNNYIYTPLADKNSFKIASAGKDGIPGTDDDILP